MFDVKELAGPVGQARTMKLEVIKFFKCVQMKELLNSLSLFLVEYLSEVKTRDRRSFIYNIALFVTLN